jgi:hypothetical protein
MMRDDPRVPIWAHVPPPCHAPPSQALCLLGGEAWQREHGAVVTAVRDAQAAEERRQRRRHATGDTPSMRAAEPTGPRLVRCPACGAGFPARSAA